MTKPDDIDVGRQAQELTAAHGAGGALALAEWLAQQALAAAEMEKHDLWTAVADVLRPE